ncbi:TetR/AcrR family transcriptional regulator [Mycolicibacterium litorale]|uniref:TetR family transcriptional regulator n=1 Tax=Mycolicibacterium litorale TaxID=758802 RepID=A0AAD1MVE5_9MYCO|nr:TetR family transcriptional regulator [Mycolicibacterium litorale]MCV7417464.1 TetR/AcrR family transcriptional regulator [Mycolicibacterium litorale]TDY05253.1 TetR family transcriptional regulator [Mycolicibacterium litorale]BBY18690.1 TetR family transcriptional regulator [Mycolicibacterium litorale]
MTARGRPSSVEAIFVAARALLDEGAPISLESVADRTGLTKPGLMYHFPTKQALMDGLVDHVARSAEQQLSQRLDIPIEQASARQRLRAYVQWAVEGPHQRSDLVMFGDPRLVDQMTRRWTEHFSRWVQVPTDMPPAERARLNAARLVADGAWLAQASATFALSDAEQPDVLAVALDLIGTDDS